VQVVFCLPWMALLETFLTLLSDIYFCLWCPVAPFKVVQLDIAILELSFSDFY